MDTNFAGKRALVTGAGQGIGRDIAIGLVKCKAHVFALSKTPSILENLKKEHPEIEIVCVDLSDWKATREAVIKLGPIDLLVNNAAVTSVKPFLEVLPEDIDRLVSVNIKAVVNVSQVVIKGLLDRKSAGSIVNVSSNASQFGLLDHTVYCATKAALDSITRVMASEFGPKQIRVNTVNPTVVLTDMGQKVWGDPVVAAPMLNRIPLNKFAVVGDVTSAVLFLLSDNAAMINGVSLNIDGGFMTS